MNDFREYQSAFLDHQDDLMHYGVKGMKWDHKKRQPGAKPMTGGADPLTIASWREKYARLRRNAMKKKAKQAAEERRKKK